MNPSSEVYNMDNIVGMMAVPNKHYDLAIIDPPYGIGEDGKSNHSRSNASKATPYTPKDWDNKHPSPKYFEELFRVSKNQIIFGANHFISLIPYNSSCWIVWDKRNTGDFADCELAWTSFDTAVRKFSYRWNGMLQENMKDKEIRIHPTQKPVALYEWILHTYAKEGDKILDTHLGSGSSRIAAYKNNYHFTGFEIDSEYYQAQEIRFNQFKAQLTLF